MWCFPDLSFFKYEIVTSVVLFRPPFYFVFDISNLLSYIQNNFSYELARPIMGTIFLVISNAFYISRRKFLDAIQVLTAITGITN